MYIVRHNTETGRRSCSSYNLFLQWPAHLLRFVIRGFFISFLRSEFVALFFSVHWRKTRIIPFHENSEDLCPILTPSPPI
jgi:hypothetical protein